MEPPMGTLGIPAKPDWGVIAEADKQAQLQESRSLFMEELEALAREITDAQALSAPGEVAENATNAESDFRSYLESLSKKVEDRTKESKPDDGADAGQTNENPSQQPPAPADDWILVWREDGAYTYYINPLTNETVGKRPTAEDPTDPPTSEND